MRQPAQAAELDPVQISAQLLKKEEIDVLICGASPRPYHEQLKVIKQTVGSVAAHSLLAAMNIVLLPKSTVVVCDTYVNPDPNADELVEIAILAAEELGHFGLKPNVTVAASFTDPTSGPAKKMKTALELIRSRKGNFRVIEPIDSDANLANIPNSAINLFMLPNQQTASITYNIMKLLAGEGVTVGPILLGPAKPAHIVTPAHTVRGILNMTLLRPRNPRNEVWLWRRT